MASLPLFGVGTWLCFRENYSFGIMVASSGYMAILLVYALDVLYGREDRFMVDHRYLVGMAYIVSLVGCYWYALRLGFPGLNVLNVSSMSIMFLVPFNAAIVVRLYNQDHEDFDYAGLMIWGLSILLVTNFIGYAAGFRNLVHGFEGRINLPFMRGIYDAAHLMSILNLMLLFKIRDARGRPALRAVLVAFFLVNFAIMLNINSRLSLLIFLSLLILFATRTIRFVRGLFTISLFTMPLMMSFSLLIYRVLSQPVFVALIERVDEEDVTTFNGRTYIWNAVADWAMDDRRGFLFGNGYHGQYQLRMLEFLAELWDEPYSYNFHLHSTFLEILMDQGIVGLLLYYAIMWYGFVYYREQYLMRTKEAPLFAAMVYLLFIWQIDIFCFGVDIGNPILFSLVAASMVASRTATARA